MGKKKEHKKTGKTKAIATYENTHRQEIMFLTKTLTTSFPSQVHQPLPPPLPTPPPSLRARQVALDECLHMMDIPVKPD